MFKPCCSSLTTASTIPFALAAVAFTFGCQSSHSPEDEDAAISFEVPDAGTPEMDAGTVVPTSTVGTPCTSDEECTEEAPTCVLDPDFSPGGYCSRFCDASGGSECPGDSICTQVNRMTSLCLAACDPGAETRQCRAEYGCADLAPVSPVCIGGCDEDTDCGSDLTCNPDGGSWAEGQCFDPGANLGDPCEGADQCPAEGYCLPERFPGWPGGSCITFGCDAASNAGCADDAHCLGGMFREPICVDACSDSDECRDGYACVADDTYPDRRYCASACDSDEHCSGSRVCNTATGVCSDPFDPSQLGQTCSFRRSTCRGGACISEQGSGFPGAYCAYVGCTPGVADDEDGCPGDGVCMDGADGLGVCLDPCASETCRDGYACRPVDAEDADSPTACLPACEDSGDCTVDGFSCDPDTGRCVES